MPTTTKYPIKPDFHQKPATMLSIDHDRMQVPFEVRSLSWMQQNRWQQNTSPRRHNYFQIIWVKQGTGTHLIDLEKLPIDAHTIYCISPGQVHQLNAHENLKGYAISFTLDFISMVEDYYDLVFDSGLFYTFDQSPVISIDDEIRKEMIGLVKKMRKEFDNYYLLRAEILRGYLKIFMIYLTRQYKREDNQKGQSRNSRLLKQFLSLLDENYTSKKMVADYAEELCITPNYLNEVVKKISGMPASEHIKQRIVIEAKRQASYTHASMKEIAYNLGFNDTSHFSKYFKNACGTNFTDFKNEISCA